MPDIQVGNLIKLADVPDRCAYVAVPSRIGVDEQESEEAPDQHGVPRVVWVRTEHRYREVARVVALDLTLEQVSSPEFQAWLLEQEDETRNALGLPDEVSVVSAYRFEV